MLGILKKSKNGKVKNLVEVIGTVVEVKFGERANSNGKLALYTLKDVDDKNLYVFSNGYGKAIFLDDKVQCFLDTEDVYLLNVVKPLPNENGNIEEVHSTILYKKICDYKKLKN